MSQIRGQGKVCRDVGGCVIQLSYTDFAGSKFIASGTRPCMRCMNNVKVMVND